MAENKPTRQLEKAAQRGEPSYVWRAGQERRLAMIRKWAGDGLKGVVLENGCGVGEYLERLTPEAKLAVGIDVEFERLLEAQKENQNLVCAAGEHLPFKSDVFDLMLSHEVIEHVQDDRSSAAEMARTLRSGGRLALFCPNRGYPFETHGIYWKGKYHFGNILFVNYLPDIWRDKLAPHVRIYTRRSLNKLFGGLPLKVVYRTTIFGAYDNIIRRSPALGGLLRTFLQFLEKTPLRALGLSHFWVLEKSE
jgi:SAM-dependent methyltransferase